VTPKEKNLSVADKATINALKRLDQVGFDSLTELEKVLSAIWALEAEVNNGGFDQFFFNSAGDLAHYAPNALKQIGAFQMAELAERANSVFGPGGPPKNWEERRFLVRQFSEKEEKILDEVTSAFYKYPDNVQALVEQFVHKQLE
jgi:hypothetical protein